MHDLPERVASAETKIEAHVKSIEELDRQKTAMWKRVDEMQSAVDGVRLEAAKESARMETKLAELEKGALREMFVIKSRMEGIEWRVGAIVTVALIIFNFIIGKIDLVGLLIGHSDGQTKSMKR